MAHRQVRVGTRMLTETSLPVGSHLVRLHPAPDASYDRMIVVSERDAGREIFLSGWIGSPLSLSEWREAKAALFPAAERVTWERLLPDGAMREVSMRI